MIAGVESEDPSSTTISSQSENVWFRTDSIDSARYRSRLNAGIIIETAGAGMTVPLLSWLSAASSSRERQRTLLGVSRQLSRAMLGNADHGTGSRSTEGDARGARERGRRAPAARYERLQGKPLRRLPRASTARR